MEFILGLLTPIFGEGFRFFLEQKLGRFVRFQGEVSAYKKSEHSFKGRRVYDIDVKPQISGPFDIKVHHAADGSGDGIIFFPGTYAAYAPPIVGFYPIPDLDKPCRGSIVIDNAVPSDGKRFTLYVATERAQAVAYIDLRYTVLDERQSERRSLLRLKLEGND